MERKIYTLKRLAEVEDTSYQYLRVLITRLKKEGRPLCWRGYDFKQAGNHTWLAVPSSLNVDIEG